VTRIDPKPASSPLTTPNPPRSSETRSPRASFAAGIKAGPIFRPINKACTVAAERLTDRSVANIVKAYAERAGFDANLFSGHSLRSGFLTSAAAKGASIFKMMDVSRHKSVDTLRGYVRDAELFKDHAGAGLL
jgi:integrase